MKRILLTFLVLAGLHSFSQPIVVNTSTYTVPQLVTDVLFAAPPGGGGSSCVGTISNISWSTGTDFGATNGIGYFTNTNPNFPLSSGVILSSGDVTQAPGPNLTTQGNGVWPGDTDLFNYINGLGIDPGLNDYNDATILEFDFTPLTSTMSFDFLFASEEYGTFQCDYSDSFAFFLTNVTAGTAPTNLALIPSTTTPISVVTIRDNTYNTACGSVNPTYFGNYNGGTNANTAATNFNGETIKMTANSTVIPNNLYHIKLVVADRNDNSYDSAVFLGGGSFDIGSALIGGTGTYDGLNDFSGPNAVCGSSVVSVQAGPVAISGVTYSWTLDGNPIPGANTFSYDMDQEGTYCVTLTYPGGCTQTDCTVVEHIPSLPIVTPPNLIDCDGIYDLTDNETVILDGMTNTVSYYHTLADAQMLFAPISNPTNYPGTDGEVIYVAVEDDVTGCVTTTQFSLESILAPTLVTPPDLYEYENVLNSGTAIFDLTPQTPIILGANNPADFTVSYYLSQADADAGINAINPINAYLNITNPQTIYVRVQDNIYACNHGTISFNLIVLPLPAPPFVSISSNVNAVCSGQTAIITFVGTPNALVDYTVDGNPAQITLNAAGTNQVVTPALSSPTTYSLIGVTANTVGGTIFQPAAGSVTISITAPPALSTPTPYVVCDENNDGKSCLFDLTTKDIEITSAPNVVAYYGTLTDAQTGSTSFLTSPYCSSTPWTETLYVRVYDPAFPGCYATTTLQLIVNPAPQANPVITDYALCDYNNAGDLVEQFTLHSKDVEIANGQANVTITYYPTQADALAQNAGAALPNSYISGSQTIWLNIKDNTTGCNSVSSFNLVVNPLPVVYIPPTIIQCSNGASTQAVFDLTVNHDAVTGSLPGLTVTYYHSLVDAQNANNPIAAPATYTGSHNEVVYVRVADNNTGCYSTTTQLLQVTQGPVAITPLPLHYCDPNNDGFGVFDLDSVKAQIQGGTLDPLVTIGFYETQTDAIVRANPSLTSPYNNIDPWTQTIYVSVYYTLTGCANYVQLQLIVDPTPEATTPTDYHLCDYTGATGQEPFDLTTKIPEILGSINPVGTQVTFYTDNTAAQNGTNVGQITNVTGYLNTSNPQTIYVRVEFTATGCYDIVPLTLVVDGLPLATQPNYAQYSLCDYTGAVGHETFDLNSQVSTILLNQTGMDVLFYPSLAAAQAGLPNTSINELYPSLQYVNVPAYVQTLGIRITNHITGCYSISTMDIRVNPLPAPIPPTSIYTLCDDNQDGIAEFDLTDLTADILQGANYLISYHETFTDADENTNVIADPAHYYNLFAFSQTLYVRAEDPITHCYTVMPFTISVDPSPIAPVNVPDIELCDQDSNPYNASTIINLTQNTSNIQGQQPPATSGYTIEYYTSKLLADAGTAPIIPATSFVGSDGQTIWVRVENNLTGCYNLGTFKLIIHTPLLLTTPPVLNMCDDDLIPNNQHTEFDLTVRDVLINQGTGYTVTYYTSSNVLITDPAHYVNGLPGAVEPITAVVTTPFGCTSSTILDIRVLPVPTPLDPSTATPELTLGVQCENATGSGVAQFDLTTNAGYIMNGDPSVTLHYFPTQADLDNNTNEILNPATAIVGDPAIAGTTVGLVQYVYIAVSSSVFSDYTGRKCYKEVKEGFVVNPLPTVAAIADFQICENDPVTNNGIEVFNLTTQNAALLAGNATTPVSNYTVAFYEGPGLTNLIANPTAYSNTSNPQTIFVQITNTTTGCKSDMGSFNLVVNPKPIIATLMPDMSSCDTDGVNDGQMLFTQSGTSPLTSLAGYTEWVLGTTQTAPTYVVEFYDNQTSAEAGISTNALTDLENYQVHTGTYWVRVENLVTGCYQLDSFDVIIEKLARPVITSNTGSNIACVTWGTTTVVNNLILDSGITAPNYTFNWYADGQLVAGENNSTINITNVATSATHVVYTVEAVSVNPPMLGCTSVITPASTFDVIKSGQATNLNYTVTNAFAENQVITVTNDGYGVYQYSMDDGPRQMSPIFENVSIGTHTIYVWDTLSPDGYSCGVQLIENVETIDFPHYFTPNYDGIHDTWNIHGLVNQPYAKIYIFDRTGKLIKQISPTTDGWDGTYNGHLMPSDDYWFTVDYSEQTTTKQYKAHFSLKR
jgi:gliding motility-associated-like protein